MKFIIKFDRISRKALYKMTCTTIIKARKNKKGVNHNLNDDEENRDG
ncbi:hypothetical protein HLPCO_001069 [Haloplasma contractile SSD-17B]|uniref:Uncharacterized protein n=1 Tax=Haloplasma contractile SSD-17B TaxID=1033810 RepID=U2FNN1_9MOLU|nr:hypothetical protein HLPCO_001069 [Haloplasma contractile SSD-17B]